MYEENLPRANYCAERVNEEGITAISCGHGRVIGLGMNDLNNVIELTGVLIKHVEALIDKEKEKLLPILRSMPLEIVLGRGQRAFVIPPGTRMDKVRKR